MICSECQQDVTPWTIQVFNTIQYPQAVWVRCPKCRYAWPVSWEKATSEMRRDAIQAELSRMAVDGMTG